ncbi:MAG: hypothetical protein HON42_00865, partial [Alphaproteobacteria bacterium]|nr:hypothetical protein [Alphaproteobacteria bacterium]
FTKDIGFKVTNPNSNKLSNIEYFFSETQARYIVALPTSNETELTNLANKSNIFIEKIGKTQNKEIEVENKLQQISYLKSLNEQVISF